MSKTGTSPTSADVYDHQISLFDSTYKPLQPENLIQRDFASVSPTVTSGSTVKNTTTPLSRKWTLREELARRKYAKWQERGLQGDGDPGPSSNSEGLDESSSDPGGGRVNTQRGRSNLMDDSDDTGAQEDRQVRRARSPSKDNSDKESSEVDILYENQRGSFLCGIPLYSHNSLLNFDPAPWTNAAFKDSPVDITTAQPPDPTWDWAWRSWYVDMSADVDEDGWEYSLAFSPYFSWHGTHPWFHSFVRRRRWLRKRVKRRQTEDEGDGLMPGSEYFSVSSNRDQSKDSSTVKAKSNSHLSHPNRISHIGTEVDVQEIRDFETLMVALRNGRIDREKIEAVTVFLDRAGEELSLLAEHMPEVMSSFVFQASRRQLLARLQRTFDAASENRRNHREHEDYTNDTEERRYQNLLQAVKAADEQVRRLEYWSDVKELVQEGETEGAVDTAQGWGSEWQGIDASGPAGTEQVK